MERGLKIGLPLAALVLALAVVAPAQVGVWVSTATGLTTSGTVAITSSSATALQVTGGIESTNAPIAHIGSNETISGSYTFTAPPTISAANSFMIFDASGGSADNRKWFVQSLGTTMNFGAINDALGLTDTAISMTRSGTSVTNITYEAAAHTFQGGRINSNLSQPSFLAYNSSNDFGSGTNTVDFDTEVYDNAGNFAADTFTAPVTGQYMLCATVTVDPDTSSAGEIVTSNRSYRIWLEAAALANDSTGGNCVLADMDASDIATVTIAGTATIKGGASPLLTYFSGRLVP